MKLTREGKWFLFATALIAVAAFNTGNNLIYLNLSLMLSFIASSYVILKINLSDLLLEVQVGGPVFAGELARAELLLYNRKKIPAYSLNLSAADVVEKSYCSHVPSRDAVKEDMTVVFNKRGLYGYRNFIGFPEFKDSSYAKSYELFCRKLVRERHYSASAYLLSDKKDGIKGIFSEPADDLTFELFARSLVAHVSAFGRDE